MPAVSMTVNGQAVSGNVEARTLLVQFLRENLRLIDAGFRSKPEAVEAFLRVLERAA